MIRLENIGKQNGQQIIFIEASASLLKGEKVGLVGPNGAGKTTLFRMITGQEQPDEGMVQVDRGITIGYFSQDVGEMQGMSAVAAVMEGAGPVSAVAAELRELETAMRTKRELKAQIDALRRALGANARGKDRGGMRDVNLRVHHARLAERLDKQVEENKVGAETWPELAPLPRRRR